VANMMKRFLDPDYLHGEENSKITDFKNAKPRKPKDYTLRFTNSDNQRKKLHAVRNHQLSPEKFKKEVKDHVFRHADSYWEMRKNGKSDFYTASNVPNNQSLKHRSLHEATLQPLYSSYTKPTPPQEMLKRAYDPALEPLKASPKAADPQKMRRAALQIAIFSHKAKYKDPKDHDFRASPKSSKLKNFDIPAVVPDNQLKKTEGLDLVHTHHRTKYQKPQTQRFRDSESENLDLSGLEQEIPKSELQISIENIACGQPELAYKTMPVLSRAGSQLVDVSLASNMDLRRGGCRGISPTSIIARTKKFHSASLKSLAVPEDSTPVRTKVTQSRFVGGRSSRPSSSSNPRKPIAGSGNSRTSNKRLAQPSPSSNLRRPRTYGPRSPKTPLSFSPTNSVFASRRRDRQNEDCSVRSGHSGANLSEGACFRMLPQFLSAEDKLERSGSELGAIDRKFYHSVNETDRRRQKNLCRSLQNLSLNNRPATSDSQPMPWNLKFGSKSMQKFSSDKRSKIYASGVLRKSPNSQSGSSFKF